MAGIRLPIKRDPATGLWEIHGLRRIDPTFPYETMGPYATKAEAEEDRAGQIRFEEMTKTQGPMTNE